MSGSVGRQLAATVKVDSNAVSFGFTGNTTRHHLIAEDVLLVGGMTVPIRIEVTEKDAKMSDTLFFKRAC